MTHRFTQEAEHELDVALTWSPQPDELDMAVGIAIATILGTPSIAHRFPRTRARQFILPRFPYSLIYAEEAGEVVIDAFAHHKRKPGYWRHRLRNP
jgi:hypothetical protein